MKIMHIEAVKAGFEELNKHALNKLPKSIFIAYIIQYKPLAKQIKHYLISQSVKITGFRQVLGCTKLKTSSPILLVSSGRFHALSLALQNSFPIYIYTGAKLEKISQSQIDALRAKRKSSLLNFLSARKIGILISTKPRQNNLKEAIWLKKQLELGGRKAYLFISDKIEISELENFRIDSWVNTACPGLAFDSSRIINLDEISGSIGKYDGKFRGKIKRKSDSSF